MKIMKPSHSTITFNIQKKYLVKRKKNVTYNEKKLIKRQQLRCNGDDEISR